MIFFFKQKTAYELRISDWSSDVCSSDLHLLHPGVRDPKTEQSVLWLSTRLEQYPTLLMLPADLDAHMATRSTTSPPTSWPAWAQRRSALCRRALSSDTASSSDTPAKLRRRGVAADPIGRTSMRERRGPYG